MPLPVLTFDDPVHGLPRQPVPLRFAYLVTSLSFREFRFLVTRLANDGAPYLRAHELGADRQVRTVEPADYEETLPRDTAKARLSATLIATLPHNHFIWSDDLLKALNKAVVDATGEPDARTLDEPNWSPALHGMDDLLAECIDLSALTSDATATSEPSQREKGKQKTAARHKAWQDACLELEQEHPDKSLSWIAQKIARSPMGEGRSVETIRKNMKSRK